MFIFATNLRIKAEMKEEIFKKITKTRTYLKKNEITPEEKKSLLQFMTSKGLSSSTFNLRFFQKGFYEWEIIGIKECKKQFLELKDVAQILLEYIDTDDTTDDIKVLKCDKGYLYTLAHSDQPGMFYQCLRKANYGLCVKFTVFMYNLGMSAGTVGKRFKEEDWKDWEIDGMKTILEDYKVNN